MNTNWGKLLEDHKAKTKVLPAGWDSLEAIAASQDVTAENTRVQMSMLVKAKKAEMGQFPVWDKVTKRVLRVTAYRLLPQAPKPSA